MKKIMFVCIGVLCAATPSFCEGGKLTLEQALELARKNSPELRAARLNTRAAEKGVGAAGRWTNPELEFEAENMGGGYPYTRRRKGRAAHRLLRGIRRAV